MIKKSDIKFKVSVDKDEYGESKALFGKFDTSFCGLVDDRGLEYSKGHLVKHMEEFLYKEILDELLPLRQMCLCGSDDYRSMGNGFSKIIDLLQIK